MKKWIISFIVLCLLLVGVEAYRVVDLLCEAEVTFQGLFFASRLVENYMVETGGRWPTSYSDLENVRPFEMTYYHWPQDRAELERRINIDFTIPPSELKRSRQAREKFITPIEPSYRYSQTEFEELWKTIERYAKEPGAENKNKGERERK
jgi:hypothetical protein